MNVAVDVRRIQLALDELGTVTRDRVIPRVMAAALLSSTEQAFERQANPDTGERLGSVERFVAGMASDRGFVPGSILTLHGESGTQHYHRLWTRIIALIGFAKNLFCRSSLGPITPDVAPPPGRRSCASLYGAG
ncbi:phage virion morphogenesis protein [Escherichia coli]